MFGWLSCNCVWCVPKSAKSAKDLSMIVVDGPSSKEIL